MAWRLWAANPILALGLLVAPIFSTVAILTLQFVALAAVNRSDPAPRAKMTEYLQAWLGEIRVCLLVFHWWQPFRRNAIANNLDAASGPARPTGRGVTAWLLLQPGVLDTLATPYAI